MSETDTAKDYILDKAPKMLRERAEFLRARSTMQSEDGSMVTSMDTKVVCLDEAAWLDLAADLMDVSKHTKE